MAGRKEAGSSSSSSRKVGAPLFQPTTFKNVSDLLVSEEGFAYDQIFDPQNSLSGISTTEACNYVTLYTNDNLNCTAQSIQASMQSSGCCSGTRFTTADSITKESITNESSGRSYHSVRRNRTSSADYIETHDGRSCDGHPKVSSKGKPSLSKDQHCITLDQSNSDTDATPTCSYKAAQGSGHANLIQNIEKFCAINPDDFESFKLSEDDTSWLMSRDAEAESLLEDWRRKDIRLRVANKLVSFYKLKDVEYSNGIKERSKTLDTLKCQKAIALDTSLDKTAKELNQTRNLWREQMAIYRNLGFCVSNLNCTYEKLLVEEESLAAELQNCLADLSRCKEHRKAWEKIVDSQMISEKKGEVGEWAAVGSIELPENQESLVDAKNSQEDCMEILKFVSAIKESFVKHREEMHQDLMNMKIKEKRLEEIISEKNRGTEIVASHHEKVNPFAYVLSYTFERVLSILFSLGIRNYYF